MPKRLTFEGHPDVGWLHDGYLFGKKLIPTDLLHEHQARNALYSQNISAVSIKEAEKLGEFEKLERPMALWMYDFVKEVETEVREKFFWTFQWHITSWYCSEESENVSASSPPYWYVSIHDFEGNIVHRNWSIAFDAEWGDLRLMRGAPSSTNRFTGVPWRERSKRLARVFDAIKEHQRIRNFRLRRTGVEIPE